MKRVLLVIALAFLTPFWVSASDPAFSNPIPFRSDALDPAKDLSAKVESYIIPESAGDKGLWPWIQEESSGVVGHISKFVKSLNSFIGDQFDSLAASSLMKSAEGILRSILQAGRDFINELFDYIKQKV